MYQVSFAYLILLWTYRLILLAVAGLTIHRLWKRPPAAIRWLCMVLLAGAIAEWGGYVQLRCTGTNIIWYTAYSLINLFLAVLYFGDSIRVLRRSRVIPVVAVITLLAGISNSIWLQPPPTANTNFIFLAAALIICCCLFSLSRLLVEQKELKFSANIHFWIANIWVGYWFLMLLCYGLLYLEIFPREEKFVVVGTLLLLDNLLTYLFFGSLLWRFNKFIIND